MSGLRMMRGKNSAILEIPIKGQEAKQFYTPISGLIKFIKGEMPIIYFNPKSDFVKEEKDA